MWLLLYYLYTALYTFAANTFLREWLLLNFLHFKFIFLTNKRENFNISSQKISKKNSKKKKKEEKK